MRRSLAWYCIAALLGLAVAGCTQPRRAEVAASPFDRIDDNRGVGLVIRLGDRAAPAIDALGPPTSAKPLDPPRGGGGERLMVEYSFPEPRLQAHVIATAGMAPAARNISNLILVISATGAIEQMQENPNAFNPAGPRTMLGAVDSLARVEIQAGAGHYVARDGQAMALVRRFLSAN